MATTRKRPSGRRVSTDASRRRLKLGAATMPGHTQRSTTPAAQRGRHWARVVAAAATIALLAAPARATPPSVASINLCADQLVLVLADPEQILTVSWLSADPEESLLAATAAHYPLNYGTAEELLRFAPDGRDRGCVHERVHARAAHAARLPRHRAYAGDHGRRDRSERAARGERRRPSRARRAPRRSRSGRRPARSRLIVPRMRPPPSWFAPAASPSADTRWPTSS